MNIVIETERLLLRLFTEQDAALIYELNQDPDVIKYTHDQVKDMEHAKEILEQTILPQYVLYKHGRWAIQLKPELDFIGWCGLKFRAEENEIDLGYRLRKEFWGKGYATEAAFASLKYGFEKLNIQRIMGRAEPENIESCKVLEKCGLTYIGESEIDGFPIRTYEIFNPNL